MNTATVQEREKELRLAGHKLDMLWMQARLATGQARTDLHNQIAPLREKLNANRKEHEALKNAGRQPTPLP